MEVGSLFTGIGGLDLGLEQAGMKTVWQVEYDDWCRERLSENFPHTEKFKDVREVGKHNLKPVDLICGGFPCQDVSQLNHKRLGLEGKRSGLWSEYFRIICELRPKYILTENVSALLNDGLERVLSDIFKGGYDAEWQVIRASAVGLPHVRKRLFIIAYLQGIRPFQNEVFKAKRYQSMFERKRRNSPSVCVESIGRSFPEIPEHLRMDDGISFELSEIERAVKGYGNAVAVPIAKWLGEQILRFDKELITL